MSPESITVGTLVGLGWDALVQTVYAAEPPTGRHRVTPAPKVGSVVINTDDPDRLAAFWIGLLGVEIARRSGQYFIWLEPQHEGGISVAFQKVDDPTEGRRRLHLDMYVEDLDSSVERALDLGASQVEEHTVGDFTWSVLADPDGNEFCLAPGH
jgi:predicted enzyme related to lactoylglutathione lyase